MAFETIEYATHRDAACIARLPRRVRTPVPSASELDEWNVRNTINWYDVEVSVEAPVEVDVAKEFASLVSTWKEETWPISSIKRRIAHPAYLRIIGMGPVAIPLILKELKHEPDHWHHALEAITGQDPTPKDSSIREVISAWLGWGERRGYCNLR